MDRTAPGRWMGRHPAVCTLIMAIASGFGPAIRLVSNPALAEVLLTVLAVVAGAGFGLLFSLMARTKAEEHDDR
ncbi:MAG: hypothetical protein LC808_03260 [Actinobacteria bacterium]|nr:hypothetical protein [Actinomycetota bacterium]